MHGLLARQPACSRLAVKDINWRRTVSVQAAEGVSKAVIASGNAHSFFNENTFAWPLGEHKVEARHIPDFMARSHEPDVAASWRAEGPMKLVLILDI